MVVGTARIVRYRHRFIGTAILVLCHTCPVEFPPHGCAHHAHDLLAYLVYPLARRTLKCAVGLSRNIIHGKRGKIEKYDEIKAENRGAWIVVVFTLNRYFHPTTSGVRPVSVLILHPININREIRLVKQRKNKNQEIIAWYVQVFC